MLDLQTYITILLVVAAISMFYIFRVVKKQLNLFKRKAETPRIRNFRRKLFAISLVIIIMGLIPITINILSLFNDGTGRPKQVPTLSLIYSAGVHIQSLLLSYILWRIYRLADEQEEIVDQLTEKHLTKEEQSRR